jgi:SWI/SNF-related matrix-associated actin-dependent regulator 1 of chromatin subfamily A
MLEINETSSGSFEVKFQYKQYLVEAIKQIPGRQFIPSKKLWLIPKSSEQALLNWASNFSAVKYNGSSEPEVVAEIEPLPELTVPIPEYIYNRDKKKKGEPCEVMPYQKTGIAYNLIHERTIVGDQPGLGKTIQAIVTSVLAEAKCILIICPATLRENWKREWKIWTDKDVMILSDRVKNTWVKYYEVGMCKVFICNYESLKKYFVQDIKKVFDKEGNRMPLRLDHIQFKETIKLFDFVIVDEAHRCKDGKTQQSKFVMGISKGKKYRLALTGTPVVNKPMDLVPQLHIIGQLESFGGYKGFVNRYCSGPDGSSNPRELNYKLHQHCYYRREKSEVLKDLPEKMRAIKRCDIETRDEYNKAEEDLVRYLKENLQKTEGEIDKSMRGEVMVRIQLLKKISARGKINTVLDHVREVIDAGEKIVVFAHHKDIVHALKTAIPGAVTVVGDDTMDQRNYAVDSFQNNPRVQVIICNIKSGGVGITLTASSRVAFIELPWHNADCDQCEDRCHRIGQKDSVQADYFLGHETIDEYIYDIIEKKRRISNQITGATDDVETSVLDEFINLFTKEKVNA